MNHHEIEQQDIIERYVRHQLPAAERRAFQEHYFACDECFAAVEGTAKFIAGVQRSSRVGVLAENAREVASTNLAPWWASFFKPAFAFGAMACLLLAVALGWIVFRPSGPLENTAQKSRPTATTTATPTPTPQASPSTAESISPSPKDEKNNRADLDNKIARSETPTPRPEVEPKGNLVVHLASVREGEKTSPAKLSPDIAMLTLRAEVEANRAISYELQIFDSGGRSIKAVGGLKTSASGTISASVSAKSFVAGKYRVKMFRLKNQQKEFAGDFEMTLRH